MKNNILIYLIISSLLIVGVISCGEDDERGPLVVDSMPPGPVSEVAVRNLPGGARIEYRIPTDEDALMVEATYQRNGSTVTARSSIFKNFVVLEGLRQVASQEVDLVVIDRSNNRSEPVKVTVSPETAPIDKLFASFELVADFGGARLRYNNEDEISAELLLYVADEAGNLVYNQSAFIVDDKRSHVTFRSFPSQSQVFGISAVDRYDNTTEILQAEIVPVDEVLLDLENFIDVTLAGDESDAFGWSKPNLWNNSIEGQGFHTAQGDPGTVVPPYSEGFHMFTIDLGVKAELSRFKFWQRQTDGGNVWAFAHGNPRLFEVWGIDELPADNGASLENWVKLVEDGEVIKPSGAPIGTNSAEDEAQAVNGEEFEFPLEAPPVRYIRFVNIQSWSGGKFMHLMELNFWGQIVE